MATPSTHPFQRPGAATAEEEACAYILARIRGGEFRPGDRLKSDEIASAIGTSRMPVRDAFQRLAAEGLLTIRPNRGAIITVLSLEDAEEIFEMRSVLEGLAVRLAVVNIDVHGLASLNTLLERMEQAMEDGNAEQWLTQHREFHEYLCSFSRRPRLVREIARLHTVVEPYGRIWFESAKRPISVRQEHVAVIEAVRSRDPGRAEVEMKDHILTTAPELAPYLESRTPGSEAS